MINIINLRISFSFHRNRYAINPFRKIRERAQSSSLLNCLEVSNSPTEMTLYLKKEGDSNTDFMQLNKRFQKERSDSGKPFRDIEASSLVNWLSIGHYLSESKTDSSKVGI